VAFFCVNVLHFLLLKLRSRDSAMSGWGFGFSESARKESRLWCYGVLWIGIVLMSIRILHYVQHLLENHFLLLLFIFIEMDKAQDPGKMMPIPPDPDPQHW
jgi:hypothetical protein